MSRYEQFKNMSDEEFEKWVETEYERVGSFGLSFLLDEKARRENKKLQGENDKLQKDLYKMTKQNLWIARIALIVSIVSGVSAVIAVWPK